MTGFEKKTDIANQTNDCEMKCSIRKQNTKK